MRWPRVRRKGTYSEHLEWMYFPNKMMKRHFPKAAKKRRILKKWLRSFGPDAPKLEAMTFDDNPFLRTFDKVHLSNDNWCGNYISVPLKTHPR